VKEMCDEPVRGLLEGCALDVSKPLKAQPNPAVEFGYPYS
jgi:hypothetical protein